MRSLFPPRLASDAEPAAVKPPPKSKMLDGFLAALGIDGPKIAAFITEIGSGVGQVRDTLARIEAQQAEILRRLDAFDGMATEIQFHEMALRMHAPGAEATFTEREAAVQHATLGAQPVQTGEGQSIAYPTLDSARKALYGT